LELMRAVEKLAPTTSSLLTRAEICDRYPDAWVCLIDIEHEPDGTIHAARVVAHGQTSRRALEQVDVWDTYPMIGAFFTGTSKPPLPRFPRVEITNEIRELVRPRR
jgi:hypothetical protein